MTRSSILGQPRPSAGRCWNRHRVWKPISPDLETGQLYEVAYFCTLEPGHRGLHQNVPATAFGVVGGYGIIAWRG